MSLSFNTYRNSRYLRSRFVEGKFLLANEATDIELEILDLFREIVRETFGESVALEDGWQVSKLSDTQLLIKPGKAWFDGFPFDFRYGKDHLVSGAVLGTGILPVGVTITDDSSGQGKIIDFTAASTPTNDYRIVIDVREEVVTEVQDPFLQNVNLTESTAQKLRLNFRINIVPEADQSNTPIPYTNDTTDQNLTNEILIAPTAAGNGELLNTSLITGSEGIDGRDLELIVRNNPAIGGGNPIPNASSDQQVFSNGSLIDSVGNVYHVNAVFNDTVSTQVVIRIDKEPGQVNPQITNGQPYTLKKREVYYTDDVNGAPQGKLFYPVANVSWNTTSGFVHESVITDLRETIVSNVEFFEKTNQKFSLKLAGGGSVVFNESSGLFSWDAAWTIINPHAPNMSVGIGEATIVDGGSLVYDMDLVNGGSIERGVVTANLVSGGATLQFDPVDLSDVRIGNIITDSGGSSSDIIAIDDVNNTVTVSTSLVATGTATIYLDSYAPEKAPLSVESFVLAVRSGNSLFITDRNLTETVYEETLEVVSGAPADDNEVTGPIVAGTPVTIPLDSRDSNSARSYPVGEGQLEVFLNGIKQQIGIDYDETGSNTSTQVEFLLDLEIGDEIQFRIDPATAGSGGSGGGGSAPDDDFNTLPEVLTADNNDPVLIFDVSASGYRKIQKSNFLAGVGSSLSVQTVNSSSTLTVTDQVVLVDCTSGNLVITLPAAASSNGVEYNIKKIDATANQMTIDANGTETIDGALTQVTSIQNVSFRIVCNGTSWFII